MARIVHWGGQDYKVINGPKSYGPFSKQEAEDFLKELEDRESPATYDDFKKLFGPFRTQLKKDIAERDAARAEEEKKRKAAGAAELKSLSFKKHFSDSQRLS
jgi:hypothetical protein